MIFDDVFDEFEQALENDLFEEKPVDIYEFVNGEDYLNLGKDNPKFKLSDNQYRIIKAGSQIYRLETLIALYGEEEGRKRHDETFTEVIMQLGKSSGKDFCSTILCCYVVYLLLCLKNPAAYYGKTTGDNIDILNIAINADQAKNVFFKGFVTKIKNSPWFKGKYNATANAVEFDKSINVYSGHSEREAFEGLNLILAILDEIAGFPLVSPSGDDMAKTAHGIYEMYRASVDSRFAEDAIGKVILLSFPRFPGDYIQQAYDRVIAEKVVVEKSHTFKLEPDLPDGIPENEFTVTWEEDQIVRYTHPNLFAMKRPTWEMNPLFNINAPAIVRAFFDNPLDALGRYACMPSLKVDTTFFKNQKAIDDSFAYENGVDENGIWHHTFVADPEKEYYMHVDLAQKRDNCAVSIGHVESWEKIQVDEDRYEVEPVVKIDATRWWTPTPDKPVNFADVRAYIVNLRRRGFNIKMCSFDQWNSNDMMNFLTQEHGIPTELLSVNDKIYDDFLTVLYDNRLKGPKAELLITELKEIRYIKNKIDHPRTGSKDLSDSVAGTIHNCVKYTPRPQDWTVEIKTYANTRPEPEPESVKGVIVAPKREVPDQIAEFIARMKLL